MPHYISFVTYTMILIYRFAFLVFAACLITSWQVYAQNQKPVKATSQGGQQDTDPKAEKVLKTVKLKMNNVADFRAKFKYVLENRATKNAQPMSKVGNLRVKKNNKFNIEFTDQSLICDGKTVWNYLKKENEVNVSEYDPTEGFNLDKILRVYDDGMKARFDEQQKLGTASISKVSLFPVKGKTDYFKIEMWVDDLQSVPLKMKVWNKNGSTVTYELSEIKVNNNLKDSDFVFQKTDHPGVSVNDLR